MPRFENIEKGKYVEIDDFGYFREGDLGNSKPKDFIDVPIEKTDSLIEELIQSGYIKTGKNGEKWDFQPNLIWEEKINSDPNNKNHYQEYAEWLAQNSQEELSNLILNGYKESNQQYRKFFGELPFQRDLEKWRHGFLQTFQAVTNRPIADLKPFLNLPILKFLESFNICQADVQELLKFLVDWEGLKNLKKLNIWDAEECGLGNLNVILPYLKHLEKLYLVGSIFEVGEEDEIVIENIDLPKLQHFGRISPNLTKTELNSMALANWPNLESLTLGIGFESDIKPKDFNLLLNNDNLKSLKYLDIRHYRNMDELLKIILVSPLLPRLKKLSFYQSNLTSKGSDFLIKNMEHFMHLESIVIRETTLTKNDEDQLLKVFSSIKPYNAFRKKGTLPYMNTIYQETFWETEEEEDEDLLM